MTRAVAALLSIVLSAAALQAQEERSELESLGYIGSSRSTTSDSGVTLYDPMRASHGFSLYTNFAQCTSFLISMEGRVMNAWKPSGCEAASLAKLQPNGDLIALEVLKRKGKEKPRAAIVRYDWSGTSRTVIPVQLLDGTPVNVHHDFQVLPNRNLLVLAEGPRRVQWYNRILDNWIVEVTPEGKTVRQISVYDALAAAKFPFAKFSRKNVGSAGNPSIDLLHTNSIWVMDQPRLSLRSRIYTPGNLLICMRHQDAIAVLDGRSGTVLWTWGRGQISQAHDARLLPNGHILLFDNGVASRRSRVIEIDPLSGKIVWEYKEEAQVPKRGFYSEARGSSQRLPNGNTLVCEANEGEAFEITRSGEVVWKFTNPARIAGHVATMSRVERYSRELVKGILDRQKVAR